MKQEPKHIVPYLPYRLNIMNACIKDVGNDYKSIMDITTLKVVLNGGYGLFVSKPTLHPLSDLTKEIEVNGEKFVPINVLRKDYSGFWFEFNFELLIKSKNTHMYISIDWMSEINNKLLEWHFDVFGLIPQNLAIDINTIQS